MRNYSIPFDYSVYNNGHFLFSATFVADFKESDIKKAASVIQENGGHPVELCALTDICDKVAEIIFSEVIVDRIPGDASLDDIDIEFQDNIPDELLKAIEPYVTLISADVKYYATVVGKETSGTARLGLSRNTFKKMVEAVAEDHCGLSDFAFLKSFAPEAYAEVEDLVKEYAFKECMSMYNEAVEAEMREFPVEVYNYV